MDDLVPDEEVKMALRYHFEGAEEREEDISAADVIEESTSAGDPQGAQPEDEE